MVRCCTDIIWAYKQDGFCLQLSVWGWKPTSNLVRFLCLVLINKWNKIWNLHSYILDLRVSFGVHTLSHCQDELLADGKCLSLSLLIEAMVLICTQVHLHMSIQLAYLHKDHWAHKDIEEFSALTMWSAAVLPTVPCTPRAFIPLPLGEGSWKGSLSGCHSQGQRAVS